MKRKYSADEFGARSVFAEQIHYSLEVVRNESSEQLF